MRARRSGGQAAEACSPICQSPGLLPSGISQTVEAVCPSDERLRSTKKEPGWMGMVLGAGELSTHLLVGEPW